MTRDNVNSALGDVPAQIDLLSIDIDGNDYWIWDALTITSPRVLVIEYNPLFRPPISAVVPYTDDFRWDGTSYYGASLKALESLGFRKGYSLVGCNATGVNAFFVRADLLNDQFCSPYTADNHYERGVYEHRRGIGRYEVPILQGGEHVV